MKPRNVNSNQVHKRIFHLKESDLTFHQWEQKKIEMRSGMCFSRFYKLSFFPLFLFLYFSTKIFFLQMKCEAQLLHTDLSTQLRELNLTKQKQIKVNLDNIFHTLHCFKVYISYYLNTSLISKNQFKFVEVNHSVWNLNSCSDLHFEWGVIFFPLSSYSAQFSLTNKFH